MSKDVLKLALEALEWITQQRTGGMIQRKATEATTAIKQALEQPAPSDSGLTNRYTAANPTTEESLAVQPAPVPEPVFCEYCGGNDEDPQDHCMDCTRPRWEPVTQKLLNAQHSWLYKDMWIAMKDGSVMTGYYKWMQGRCPDRFIVGDCASLWAFEATHVMPMNKPKHPNEGRNT
jgi:hypothetical protein